MMFSSVGEVQRGAVDADPDVTIGKYYADIFVNVFDLFAPEHGRFVSADLSSAFFSNGNFHDIDTFGGSRVGSEVGEVEDLVRSRGMGSPFWGGLGRYSLSL